MIHKIHGHSYLSRCIYIYYINHSMHLNIGFESNSIAPSLFCLLQAGSKAVCRVSVHVLDRNDNSPVLVNTSYKGVISEAAPIGSLVLLNDTLPMLIKASDADSGSNGLLQYEIVEFVQSRMFHVVSNTGRCIDTVTGVRR